MPLNISCKVLGRFRVAIGTSSEAVGRSGFARGDASSWLLSACSQHCCARYKSCVVHRRNAVKGHIGIRSVFLWILHTVLKIFIGRHVQVVINCAGEEKRTAEASGQENQDWYVTKADILLFFRCGSTTYSCPVQWCLRRHSLCHAVHGVTRQLVQLATHHPVSGAEHVALSA